ncbi:OsmC family protein [Leucobacter sp. UCMA 4100]|uniref:OsmC family protein n=1 Tax=Leucobacter sp. UCMA 4100 TaxID=2810534 RepID=UPI0022EA297C|nr:OsmC family protein [Leucobacter sp. UCMA 4100]MDA3146320.1 OsmC family protein [Leucobacter sp. UCMA 4100]
MTTSTLTTETTILPVTSEERSERLGGVLSWSKGLAEKPGNAGLAVSVSGESAGAVATSLRARQHSLTVDEPPTLGGDDLAANPVEYALTALIACQVVTYRLWAEKLGISVEHLEVTAEGNLDTRGFFGVDDAVRPGFQGIDVTVKVTGPESAERYAELQAAVEAHCPVQDLFANPTPVRAHLVTA